MLIANVRDLWQDLSPKHPHRGLGLKVLDRLLEPNVEFGSLPTGTISIGSNLSPAHIVRDLHAQAAPRYRNQLRDLDDNQARFCDFVAGWVALAHDPGADVTDPSQIPYSASDISARENGLGAVDIQRPSQLNE